MSLQRRRLRLDCRSGCHESLVSYGTISVLFGAIIMLGVAVSA